MEQDKNEKKCKYTFAYTHAGTHSLALPQRQAHTLTELRAFVVCVLYLNVLM